MAAIKGRRPTLSVESDGPSSRQAGHGSPVLRVDASANHEGHTPRRKGPIEMSPRQQEVLQLFAQGLTDKEVAQELEISPRTVQTHMKNFLAKNRIRTRLEAVATWSCQVCRGG